MVHCCRWLGASRARQGLPDRIEDPAAITVLAAPLRATSQSRIKPKRDLEILSHFEVIRPYMLNG
jgi:hypothetical protein